ncbi:MULTISPECIES: tetratricopeptide repeat protein [unclassified Ectothiorhodospira]|uniref:YfgM family protein n=1 Tax=unclassified Ectothiorhodospira TaxID=2684909 RepID=UPI001EE82746|nr:MULTISPECIES: tetratricopeptide repeat protein [unclassified Ectothiorhodospira]MCG5515395.1 tetratricopeptide repeat protein [Ectothiorhodospira sp. 9100]MCG5518252.1 tetratricopeptide repeat protein [Ectothiorhodospira sp. 9905]
MSQPTDEDRIEAIKKWWSENGTAMILGLLLGIGSLVGWRMWTGYVENQSIQASEIYLSMQGLARVDAEAASEQGRMLKEDFQGTPYAMLAALDLARMAAEAEDLEGAETHLRWVIDRTRHDDQKHLARARLARVLIADGRYQDALDTLDGEIPEGFLALVEELRGDAHRGLDEPTEARAAYDRAILASAGVADYLRMKRDDLSEADATGAQ